MGKSDTERKGRIWHTTVGFKMEGNIEQGLQVALRIYWQQENKTQLYNPKESDSFNNKKEPGSKLFHRSSR